MKLPTTTAIIFTCFVSPFSNSSESSESAENLQSFESVKSVEDLEPVEEPPFYESLFKDFTDNSYYDDKGINLTYYGRTLHLGSRNRYEDNNIIGIGYKGFELGTMINSFENRSYMFSYHKKWPLNDWADLGFRLGGMTGYTKEENSFQLLGITPIISPTITVHYNGFGFETGLQTDVLVFSLNYQF
ncbi:hypothetical protein KI655_09060 [Vibrio sp. D404a]|uniref:hypothetical protein n=1 Tax=unclassified Vibrio TaxID=2614977 RepID=UPI0025571B5B|nr:MULTISPECIES: hypothetical protein [unclassified Vibrio]MDK9737448.1 hypothetical protein [Vibrio sp. D404a]MDK9799253.1 hypothetical protein [Vibrio sp. D449a]